MKYRYSYLVVIAFIAMYLTHISGLLYNVAEMEQSTAVWPYFVYLAVLVAVGLIIKFKLLGEDE